jgi:hypothetical protein
MPIGLAGGAQKTGIFIGARCPQKKAKKKAAQSLELCGLLNGARGRNRTGTSFTSGDFESPASTNFTTRAERVKPEIMAQWPP